MTDRRVCQVLNNFEKNLKLFLINKIDDLLLEKVKTRFTLSRRKLDLITDVTILIRTLEKLGELDAFNIESLEIMKGTMPDGPTKAEFGTLIQVHKTLIKKCDNVVVPVVLYAHEVFDSNRYRGLNNNINNFRSNFENTKRREEKKINTPTSCEERNILYSDQYCEAIEIISLEIADRWMQLARYLGMKEYEIDEISHDNEYRKLQDKSRRSLYIALKRKSPDTLRSAILGALSRARRNDLKERVEKMI